MTVTPKRTKQLQHLQQKPKKCPTRSQTNSNNNQISTYFNCISTIFTSVPGDPGSPGQRLRHLGIGLRGSAPHGGGGLQRAPGQGRGGKMSRFTVALSNLTEDVELICIRIYIYDYTLYGHIILTYII